MLELLSMFSTNDSINKKFLKYCASDDLTFEGLKNYLESEEIINIQYKNDFNQTALHIICQNEKVSIDIVKYLIDRGANTNCEDLMYKSTPFHFACLNTNVSDKIIKLFEQNGADINLKDESGKTPMNYLLENKPEIGFFLIKSGLHYNTLHESFYDSITPYCEKILFPQIFFKETNSKSTFSFYNFDKFKSLCVDKFCDIDHAQKINITQCYEHLQQPSKNIVLLLLCSFKEWSKTNKKIFPKPLQLVLISMSINDIFLINSLFVEINKDEILTTQIINQIAETLEQPIENQKSSHSVFDVCSIF